MSIAKKNKVLGQNVKIQFIKDRPGHDFRYSVNSSKIKKKIKWKPKVKLASALHQIGIEEIWNMISAYEKATKANDFFQHKRQEQNKFWLLQTINDRLKANFYQQPKIKTELKKQLKAIENNETTPFVAATYLLKIAKDL